MAKADLDQCNYHTVGPYRKELTKNTWPEPSGDTYNCLPGPQTASLYSQQVLLSEGAPLQDRSVPATGLDFSAFPLLPFPCSHFCATQPEGKHDADGTYGLALGQAFRDQTGSSSMYPNYSCETGLLQIMNHVPQGVKKRGGGGKQPAAPQK